MSTVPAGDLTPARAPAGDPVFTVLAAEPTPHAATPSLRLHLHVSDPAGRDIHTIALSAQLMIDPGRRRYEPAERERLVEMFGPPERWAATTHSFQWARIDLLVGGFCGATSFDLDVPCTYDLEVAAAKYCSSLDDGHVPLSLHFSGMVLYAGERDRLQVVRVPWSCSATWRMPVARWHEAIAAHYPGDGWVRLGRDTIAALAERKAQRGELSFDACVAGLLREDGG